MDPARILERERSNVSIVLFDLLFPVLFPCFIHVVTCFFFATCRSARFWILHRLKPLSQSNNWENCQSAMRMEVAFTPNPVGADHFDLFLILSMSYAGNGFKYCCKISQLTKRERPIHHSISMILNHLSIFCLFLFKATA